MQELLQTMTEPFAIRALIACSMVGIMCGIIGCFIVLRNMSMIGDALSHAILPGIFVSFVLVGYSTIGFFVGSVVAGVVTALLITWIQHNVKTKNDASIGIVFTFMFSLGVLGISWLSDEKGAHLDLQDFLFGTAMGISTEDVIITALVMVYTIISVAIMYRYLFATTFQPTIAETMGISVKMVHYFLMLLLSFAVVASLRTVGVILVVAMLVTPSSIALLLSNRLRRVIVISALVGLLSAILGLMLAIYFNTPPGPMMVVVATALYALSAAFAPEKGLVPRYLRKVSQANKIEQEDILKYMHKQDKAVAVSALSEYLGIKSNRAQFHISALSKEGYLTSGGQIELTYKGKQKAEKLVRAHRLWESYQVEKMGLQEGQIHDEAERLEHHLTEDILDQVDQKLGYPATDPHGSPIPPKRIKPKKALLDIRPGKTVNIAGDQISEEVESDLWELGWTAGMAIQMVKIGKEEISVKVNGQNKSITARLAEKINVDSPR